MRKDIKSTAKVDIRLTVEEKEKLKQIAQDMGMTMSDFVRYACEQIFKQEEKE